MLGYTEQHKQAWTITGFQSSSSPQLGMSVAGQGGGHAVYGLYALLPLWCFMRNPMDAAFVLSET